jgi:hypothetical protein
MKFVPNWMTDELLDFFYQQVDTFLRRAVCKSVGPHCCLARPIFWSIFLSVQNTSYTTVENLDTTASFVIVVMELKFSDCIVQ